jgi:prepilin-type N-terminal cleavage/methylation domain-containing protein/prepilin-type processing-associated H-X9-DG protein
VRGSESLGSSSQNGNCRGGRCVAFTLVELLVVIAVIAILASLLLPALNRGRIGADNAVCRNNLRQYAVALRLYVDDFKYYPPCYLNETNAAAGHEIYWHQRLEAYTKTQWVGWSTPIYKLNGGPPMPRTIQMCPSFARLRSIQVGPGSGCYAYNNLGWPIRDRYDQGGLGGTLLPGPLGIRDEASGLLIDVPLDRLRLTRDAEVLKPCDMISIGDAGLYDGGILGYFGWLDLCVGFVDQRVDLGNEKLDGQGLQDTLRDLAVVHQRHAARWNFVFCDGHSEHGRTRDFFDEKQVEEIRRWNRDNRGY